MKKCTCRKGAVAIDCPRHVTGAAGSWDAYYLFTANRTFSFPRSRSLWQRLIRWVRS